MKTGDTVRVYPHGKPHLAADAVVVLLSENRFSIAVAFADKPPFAVMRDGFAFHPELGIVMFASRVEMNGAPWGPWVEIFNESHFEIECSNVN